MNKSFILCIVLFFIIADTFAQELIDVTDQTIKVGGMKEEELFYGFAEGDKIIFNFQEMDNKELKELEISAYPSNSKFSEYKSKKVENKQISVTKTGVYVFRLKNSAVSGRICKIRIQRIPANDQTKSFNSNVTWVIKQDTTWNSYTKDVIIGYDTTYVQKTRKELVKIDTLVTPLFDKTIRVHSGSAIGTSQYSYATVELPKNTYDPNILYPYQSTEVISWSYWLGVGQKALADYEKANNNFATGISTLGALTGYGALASLAGTGISIFSTPTVGENVQFKFYGVQNGQEIIIDHGNVISASARNEKVKQGSFSIQLYNNNFMDGIDVTVKMVALQVSKTWKDIPYTDTKVTARKEKQIFRDPLITSKKVPIVGN